MPKSSTKAACTTRGSPRKLTADLQCMQCNDLPLRSQCPHSPEGRLYLEAHMEKPQRTPQQCNKCPDRLLRSQCIHTNAGREFICQRDIEQTLKTPLTETEHRNTVKASNGGAVSAATPGNSTPLPHTVLQETPASAIAGHPSSVQRDSIPSRTTPRGLIPIHPDISTPRTGFNPLYIKSSPLRSPSAPFSQVSDVSSGLTLISELLDVFGTVPATSLNKASFPLLAPQKYQRPTKSNPRFGFVNGAMRGTQDLAILRKHRLPSPSKDAPSASKDFLEGIHRVLEKAEDVAAKTGCWIFVGAQHPSAASGTIHYTSQRLRCDAPEDTEGIVNDFNGLMVNLLRARRTDVLEATKKLEEASQKNAALQMEVLELKSIIKKSSMQNGE